ncbi:MAG: HypC/HybG/HupF family hydrogenase formation chaperone [Kiritimatiellaeota bacterium]|nr:HypC/HybG/HupF family hydrogenase formation chaperone [Kiritimatiellota bacterium]
MCLAVPALIVEKNDDFLGVVDVNGARRECNLAFVPDAETGDHVLIHAGFAIKKWTAEEVEEFHGLMDEIGSKTGIG